MSAQIDILRACDHEGRGCEVSLGRGEVIYVCPDCWNRSVAVRRAERKAEIERVKAQGREYWRARGIKVGERVYRVAVSWFGLGAMEIEGTAKVGQVGAYVCSKYQKGYLSPEGWHKRG